MQRLCSDARTAWLALGSVDYARKSSELANVKFRRSIYSVKDIRAGQVITSQCVRSVRPGYGLPPKYLPKIIGSIAAVDIPAYAPITIDLIKDQGKV
jgi:N-acetylneuraminate synthase